MKSSAWPLVRLRDLLRVKHGFAFKSAFFSEETGDVLLTPGNFEETGGLKFRPEKDRSYAGAFPAEFRLRAGELLVVMTDLTQEARILGAPAFVPEAPGCLHNQRLGKIVDVDVSRIDQRFLYYLFNYRGFREAIKSTASGSTVKHTSPGRIESYQVRLPPLSTQRRIASILGGYDDLIEVNRRRIAVLEEMARRLFEEWFVHFRFPGYEGHAMVETPEGPLPEGWVLTTLGEVCEQITDGAHHSPPSAEVGQLMASVKDMRDWDFDLSSCRRISDEDFEELVRNGCSPVVGDILIAKDGANLNKHTFLMWRDVKLVLLSSIAILRPPQGFEREYLVSLLKSEATSEAIKQMKSGAAIPRIVLRDFKRLRVVLPPRDLRQAFENLAGPAHDLIRRISQANAALAKSRDLILPRLISGEVSVTAAERELEAVA